MLLSEGPAGKEEISRLCEDQEKPKHQSRCPQIPEILGRRSRSKRGSLGAAERGRMCGRSNESSIQTPCTCVTALTFPSWLTVLQPQSPSFKISDEPNSCLHRIFKPDQFQVHTQSVLPTPRWLFHIHPSHQLFHA